MNWRMTAMMMSLVMLQIGCSAIMPMQKKSTQAEKPIKNDEQNSKTVTPVRMAVIWKENVLRPEGKNAVKGFTGRLYFYNDSDELATADGELVVYGYDDSQSISSDVADRKYVFPAEKFAGHYSKSELGHSYSIWIPWEEYGGERKSISLVPVFKTTDNQFIQGSTNRLSLTGRPPSDSAIIKTNANEPQSGPMAQPTGIAEQNANGSPNRMTANPRQSDSFQIPKSLATRMANVPANWVQAADQQLPNTDSPEINPDGQLYNRVKITRSTTTGNESYHPNATTANFSDSTASTPNNRNSRPTFGKPGTFR